MVSLGPISYVYLCIANVEQHICAQHGSDFHAKIFLVRRQVFLNQKM
jgi:hypothetical protein